MTLTAETEPAGLTGQGRYAVAETRPDGRARVLSEHDSRTEADDYARQGRLGNPGRWTVWDTAQSRTVIVHH